MADIGLIITQEMPSYTIIHSILETMSNNDLSIQTFLETALSSP